MIDNSQPTLSVAIVSSSLSRAAGGILPIMQAHARQLVTLGIDVTAFGVQDRFSTSDAASWAPISPNNFIPSYRRFAFAPELDRALLSAPIDIVHQHGLWLYPSLTVSRWRRRRGRPVVISTQGMLEPWALTNSSAKKSIAAALFERSNLIGASCLQCSTAEVDGVRRFGLKNPIAVLPNGADLPAPDLIHPRPSWLPHDERRTLLFLGRLHPKKGVRETLEAWKQLRTIAPEIARQWRIVVAGWDDGGHAESLTLLARNLDIADDVIFPGPLFDSEKQAALSHADAFILASYSEGLPMAVLEAWSHALPVFMTRECNLSDSFASGAAIEIRTDPGEMALVLLQWLSCAKLPAIGRRGRELVEQKFMWASVVRELLTVYLWLARGADRPACVVLQ